MAAEKKKTKYDEWFDVGDIPHEELGMRAAEIALKNGIQQYVGYSYDRQNGRIQFIKA